MPTAEPRADSSIGRGGFALRLLLTAPLALGFAALAWRQSRWDGGASGFYGIDQWVAGVDRDFRVDDVEAAQALAMARLHPLDGRIDRILYSHALLGGRRDEAERWLRRARERAPRDVFARAALGTRALADGNDVEASLHYDAFLRLWPAQGSLVFDTLSAHLVRPSMQAAWLRRLAFDPPWRADFTRWMVQARLPVDVRRTLFEALARDGHGTAGEFDDRLAMLQRAGLEAEARALWRARVGATTAGGVHPQAEPTDDLARPLLKNGYGWLAGDDETFEVVFPATPGGAIEIHFSGDPVSGVLLRQRLALPAGGYVLSSAYEAHSPSPIGWTLMCLTTGVSLGGVAAGQANPSPLVVPPDCPAQQLELAVNARSLAERKVNGVIRVGPVRLARTP